VSGILSCAGVLPKMMLLALMNAASMGRCEVCAPLVVGYLFASLCVFLHFMAHPSGLCWLLPVLVNQP
jgi:hypothetical protein